MSSHPPDRPDTLQDKIAQWEEAVAKAQDFWGPFTDSRSRADYLWRHFWNFAEKFHKLVPDLNAAQWDDFVVSVQQREVHFIETQEPVWSIPSTIQGFSSSFLHEMEERYPHSPFFKMLTRDVAAVLWPDSD